MSTARLYVSDLDGTLLRDDATLSPFAFGELDRLLRAGLPFTVASARSIHSIRLILGALPITLPVIEFNGSHLTDYATGRHLMTQAIEPELLDELLATVLRHGCRPFVSSCDGARDRLYYDRTHNGGMEWYVRDREERGDPRLRRIDRLTDAFREEVVCLTLIDRAACLAPIHDAIGAAWPGRIKTQFYENRYSPGWHWLTIHPGRSTKAHALEMLMTNLKIAPAEAVVFGDFDNDIEMFELVKRGGGRAVAVAGASDALKRHATEVIGGNAGDSVVRYIAEMEKARKNDN